MPRTLILKFGAIGDVVMLVPAAHRMHLAGYEIDWVCGPGVLPILELYPWICTIVVDDRAILKGTAVERLPAILGLWRMLAGRHYDVCATFYYDSRYKLLALPVRAGRKFQLSHEDRRYRLLPGRHHTDEYARVLLGLPDEVRPVQLAPVRPETMPASPLPRTGRQRVVLAPAGAKNMMADDALRRWPAEDYVRLATLLGNKDVEAVLIGGPDDGWVQPLFAGVAVVDLIGKLTLLETLGLMDEADVVVTHDTGPLHLAGMTHAGIVTLFGPTDPRGRLPQRPGTLALWGGEGFACRPCYDGRSFAACPRNDCIRQYRPETVVEEVMGMLEDRTRGMLTAPRVKVPGRIA
jgi:heptosyltransferase-2